MRAHPASSAAITLWFPTNLLKNIQCGGNDLRLGLYAAEWNSLDGDTLCSCYAEMKIMIDSVELKERKT